MVAHDALQDAAGQGQADAHHAAAEDPGNAHVPHDEPCVRLPVDERLKNLGNGIGNAAHGHTDQCGQHADAGQRRDHGGLISLCLSYRPTGRFHVSCVSFPKRAKKPRQLIQLPRPCSRNKTPDPMIPWDGAFSSSSRSSDSRLKELLAPASELCLPSFPVTDFRQRASASAHTAAVPSGILTRFSIILLT